MNKNAKTLEDVRERERERERESNNLEEHITHINLDENSINTCRGDFFLISNSLFARRAKKKSPLHINRYYSREKTINKTSGITLIALIITIILLLILAGVTLHFTLGENGILRNAEIAGNKYKEEEQKEKNALDEMYSKILVAGDSKVTLTMEQLDEYIKRKIDENNSNKVSIKATSSKTYTTNSTSDGVKVNLDNIIGDTKNKFSIENGNIKIEKGIKRILVTGFVNAKSNEANQALQMYILKNNEIISSDWNRTPSTEELCRVIPFPVVIDVNEGDYISVKVMDWGGGGTFSACNLMIYE